MAKASKKKTLAPVSDRLTEKQQARLEKRYIARESWRPTKMPAQSA